jgi:hypothetical protein
MASAKVPDLTRQQLDLIKKTAPHFNDDQIIKWFADFKSFTSENDCLTLSDFTRFYKNIILSNKNEGAADSNEFCKYIFKGEF